MTVMVDFTGAYLHQFKFFLREGKKFYLLVFFEYLLGYFSGISVYLMIRLGIPIDQSFTNLLLSSESSTLEEIAFEIVDS